MLYRSIAVIFLLGLTVFPLEAAHFIFEKDLYFGLKNDQAVRVLQERLEGEGCFEGAKTGNFGPLTRAGVICFQKKYNFNPIPSTGYVGPYTRKVLNDLAATKESAEQNRPEEPSQPTVEPEEETPDQTEPETAPENTEGTPVIPPSLEPTDIPPIPPVDDTSEKAGVAPSGQFLTGLIPFFIIIPLVIVILIAVHLALKKGRPGYSLKTLLGSSKTPMATMPDAPPVEERVIEVEKEIYLPSEPAVLIPIEKPRLADMGITLDVPKPKKEVKPDIPAPEKKLYIFNTNPISNQSKGNFAGATQVWKRIRIGTKKSAEELIKALSEAGYKINAYHNIFSKSIEISKELKEIDIFLLNISDLGFRESASYSEVKNKAISMGFSELPAEAGLELRLQYSDQPDGESVIIAMQPVIDSHGDQVVFSIENDRGEKSITGLNVTPGNYYGSDHRFAFTKNA